MSMTPDAFDINATSSVGGFEVGSSVKQVVDWTRRFDNMQQHSGILLWVFFTNPFL